MAGRRTALTRVKTSASRPLADDVGGFEIDSTNWKEGSGDSSFIAVASDDDIDAPIPKFKRDDADLIARFISMQVLTDKK